MELSRQPKAGEDLETYLQSMSEFNRQKYMQVLQKNNKLREELRVITEATENLLAQEREKKRASRSKKPPKQNHEIQAKKHILQEQQKQILLLKE